MSFRNLAWVMIISGVISSCYSFKGISIDPGIKNFEVVNFDDQTTTAPPYYRQLISEELTEKILSESRLKLARTNPDLIFSGKVTSFQVSSKAPQAGETTSLNELKIVIEVEMKNMQDESKNWKKSFQEVRTFQASQSLLSVQDELFETMNELFVEDIFNTAFTNW